MRRALLALGIVVASVAVLAAAGDLFYGRYPFSVYVNGAKAKDYLLEVREVNRDETSSLVTLTITPEYALSPDSLVTHVCFFATARGKTFFTMRMQSAAPPTYVVNFPEDMEVTLTDRDGETPRLVRSVKMCEPKSTGAIPYRNLKSKIP